MRVFLALRQRLSQYARPGRASGSRADRRRRELRFGRCVMSCATWLKSAHGWPVTASATVSCMSSSRPPCCSPIGSRRRLGPSSVKGEESAALLVLDEARNALEEYEEQQEQTVMARAIGQAISNHDRLIVEAGTGVGKSLAYLVPTALQAMRNGERTVISTNTNQPAGTTDGARHPCREAAAVSGGHRRRRVAGFIAEGSRQLPLPPSLDDDAAVRVAELRGGHEFSSIYCSG